VDYNSNWNPNYDDEEEIREKIDIELIDFDNKGEVKFMFSEKL